MKKVKIINLIKGCAFLALAASINTYAEDISTDDNGNRYNKDREYLSEISAARAYLDMKTQKGILIDVRRLREYAAGHPEKAFNVPYPHIVGSPYLSDGTPNPDYEGQEAANFYWEVYDLVNGKTDTLIMTLCRTGSRSVDAGNILANPESYDINGPEFSNVRNIWEGFVGQYKYAYAGGNIAFDEDGNPIKLDLNNNGYIDSDTADVYDHTSDANPDKDGWRNFQELPWTTKLKKNRVYLQDRSLYDPWTE